MFNDEMVQDETLEIQEEAGEVEFEPQEPAEEVEDEVEEEEVDWKTEAQKAKELADNYKKRAEKAEAKAKTVKPTAPSSDLSASDLLALTKANIEADDLDEVLEYAKYKKVSIADALKSSIVKATLAEKAEFRKSAAAVTTGGTRRAGGQISDERLLADAQRGVLPESSADIARLARLRISRR